MNTESGKHNERAEWGKTTRFCLTLVTVTCCLIAINFFMATKFSGDDWARIVLGALTAGGGMLAMKDKT